jgi:hypothetical protein
LLLRCHCRYYRLLLQLVLPQVLLLLPLAMVLLLPCHSAWVLLLLSVLQERMWT